MPLPGLGPTGIPVATPVSSANSPADIYQLEIQQFQQQILPPPYGKTTFWGYLDANPSVPRNPRYLGPVIVAQKDKPVQLIVTNKLPPKHILPVDTSLPGAEPDQPQNRAVVHLHGGLIPGPWMEARLPGSRRVPGRTRRKLQGSIS